MKPRTCAICGKEYVPRSWNTRMTPLCSPECKEKGRAQRRKVVTASCKECGTEVVLSGRDLYKVSQDCVYCSKACRDVRLSRVASQTMAATNKRCASERMKRNNPMKRESSRRKMGATLRAMGHKPSRRGGNGQYTVPQMRLAGVLGWEMEVAIATPGTRWSCLKVDVGNRAMRIAVEVDGYSHHAFAVR